MKKELGIFLLLLAVCVALTIAVPHSFLDPYNVNNLLKRISMYGIFSIGLAIVIITGGIDLSVGSVFALQGVLLTIMLNGDKFPWGISRFVPGGPWWPSIAVLVSILFCMVLGAFHGFLVTKVKLQPFIVTLCGLMMYRSMARSITDDHSEGIGGLHFGWLNTVAEGKLVLPKGYYIPSAFIILGVVAVVMAIVLHLSVYGRYLYAIGRNEEAARFSGINTRLVTGSAYVICLLLAGIAGIVICFDVKSIGPSNFGLSYELTGIAAAVLGGCSLKGGEGSVLGVILGTALLQVLLNAVQLLGIHSTWEMMVMGTVILVGVIIDQLIKDRKTRVKAKPGLRAGLTPDKAASGA